MMKDIISHGFETKQANAGSYLAATSIVLFASVITTTNAQARNSYRIAPTEVVVYEGNPIDYSNRDDVIVIDESYPQNSSSNVLMVQDFTEGYSNQTEAVAYHTSPTSQPQSLNNATPTLQSEVRPTQPKATPLALQSIASIAQNELGVLNKKQSLITNMEGKDPELVAFYADVFGKQESNQSKQPTPSTRLAVQQTLNNKVVQKKPKPNNVQLSKTTSKGKDPELVAFYKYVFGNDKSSSSKHVSTVERFKVKDPELVAFYEREFGESTSRTIVPVLTKNVSNKIKIARSSKSNQKRSVKKFKGKTKNSVSTAAVELQRLIDDLTSKNII